jgi:hypothetical protein
LLDDSISILLTPKNEWVSLIYYQSYYLFVKESLFMFHSFI